MDTPVNESTVNEPKQYSSIRYKLNVMIIPTCGAIYADVLYMLSFVHKGPQHPLATEYLSFVITRSRLNSETAIINNYQHRLESSSQEIT